MTTAMNSVPDHSPLNASPFNLDDDATYQGWRSRKLASFPGTVDDVLVPVADVANVTEAELKRLKQVIALNNLVIYDLQQPRDAAKAEIRQFARQVGLDNIDNNICSDEDSITVLQVSDEGQKRIYIPYTNRRLSWHTDGYYNTPEHQIRGMLLHCVTPAIAGGENMLLDHEMLYIELRDHNPDFIRALMRDDVMTIPPNNEGDEGAEIRGAQSGPVFSLEKGTGNLHMRYSARTRNIIWSDDALTADATAMLTDCLSNSPYILRYKLEAGQGVICNNVLHNRTSFEDSDVQHRLLYRARFYDRVADTDVSAIIR